MPAFIKAGSTTSTPVRPAIKFRIFLKLFTVMLILGSLVVVTVSIMTSTHFNQLVIINYLWHEESIPCKAVALVFTVSY
jgi:hypothetical protein